MAGLSGAARLRRVVRWLLILAVVALPLPARAYGHAGSIIAASRGIGPFALGMSPADIETIRRTAPCDVQAIYVNGRATRLETNCGGAYRTAEHVQVGIGPSRMLWYYGHPDRVTSSDFAQVRGEWMHYNAGISFRIIYGDSPANALIQAIAVYRGSGRLVVRQQPAPPSIAPPPGVGE